MGSANAKGNRLSTEAKTVIPRVANQNSHGILKSSPGEKAPGSRLIPLPMRSTHPRKVTLSNYSIKSIEITQPNMTHWREH